MADAAAFEAQELLDSLRRWETRKAFVGAVVRATERRRRAQDGVGFLPDVPVMTRRQGMQGAGGAGAEAAPYHPRIEDVD